ncbi:MAG: lmo0937 family membrane protein [Candidatus Dadabacteria bacterium]
MGNILYILIVILVIGWLLGMFAFHAGGLIHTLLVIAVILFIINLVSGRRAP